MGLELLHYTITFILIFTTLYSYGLLITEKLNYNFCNEIFFKILTGYTFIGTLTLIFHFFFNIGNLFSLFLIINGLAILGYFFYKKLKREVFIFLIILIFISPVLFGYSDHPIDSDMYHHPYISYLKSEKIIFAIANIQFRFGHISFLQYTQSALSNDYLHNISIASINIIFYFSFIFFIFKKIKLQKNFDYTFLACVLISCFLLVKFARYREYGNDLIPLLVSFYFLIYIIQEIEKETSLSKFSINLIFPFFVFMFIHKISYSFTFLIFLILINFKTNFFKNIKLSYLLVFLIIFFVWLLKNYITTSCLAYPLELSCLKNSLYHLSGIADPSKASWLTTIWSKGFIDHPDWRNLDLNNFVSGLNWVPTWIRGHFIKILEIMSPLFFIIFLFILFFLFKKKEITFDYKIYSKYKKKFFLLSILIFLGLCIWFLKAPVFRYGAFYIISFIVILFISFLSHFFEFKKFNNISYFKNIFLVCFVFFMIKNCLRIYDSNTSFFPKTVSNNYMERFDVKSINGLIMLKSPGESCYYTKYICSHETPKGIKVKKLKNYYMLVE